MQNKYLVYNIENVQSPLNGPNDHFDTEMFDTKIIDTKIIGSGRTNLLRILKLYISNYFLFINPPDFRLYILYVSRLGLLRKNETCFD